MLTHVSFYIAHAWRASDSDGQRSGTNNISEFFSFPMSQNGGKRLGAGRKRGGHNRFQAELMRRIDAQGYMNPLDYLLNIVNDPKIETAIRARAARDAAPYVHRHMPQEVILQADVEIAGVEIEVVGRARSLAMDTESTLVSSGNHKAQEVFQDIGPSHEMSELLASHNAREAIGSVRTLK